MNINVSTKFNIMGTERFQWFFCQLDSRESDQYKLEREREREGCGVERISLFTIAQREYMIVGATENAVLLLIV